MNKKYLNSTLAGAVLLVVCFVAMHFEFYHISLIFLLLVGVVLFARGHAVDSRLLNTWHWTCSIIVWVLVGVSFARLIPFDTFETIKILFESSLFVLLISIGTILSYYNNTFLSILKNEEKLGSKKLTLGDS